MVQVQWMFLDNETRQNLIKTINFIYSIKVVMRFSRKAFIIIYFIIIYNIIIFIINIIIIIYNLMHSLMQNYYNYIR